MPVKTQDTFLTTHEAACVTGVPLKRVRRVLDAGLLEDCVKDQTGARIIPGSCLVALMLADETSGILTAGGRRQLVRYALDHPDQNVARAGAISVDVRPMKKEIKERAARLRRARRMVSADKSVMGGMPCFKGTRIPVHLIAGFLGNVKDVGEVLWAYPTLTESQVTAAPIYAETYPLRTSSRREPWWRRKNDLIPLTAYDTDSFPGVAEVPNR